jgi:carbamoyl-phosphate synthase large subunit
MKVLVTGAGALLGQGIIRSLHASALQPTIVTVDPSPLSAGLYWADAAYLIPMANDPAYLDRIRDILLKEKPDVVLIGTDVELLIFAAHRQQLEQEFNTRILVSDQRVVSIADDKWLTYQFLKDNDFDHPESCLPGDEEQLIEAVGFPLIVKPRVGARSVGVGIAHNRDDLRRMTAAQPNVIIQELVGTSDTEYTAGALYFDGMCNASIVMRRDLRDGNTYRAYVEPYPDLNEVIRRLTEKLQPYGPVNFQFRSDKGRVKVFEINGRFSGTTPLRASAGFNEVDMSLRHLLLGEPIVQPPVEPMIILRHWSETIVRPSELLQG